MAKVEVGQVWRDRDKRMGNRHVKVMSLNDWYAFCQQCDPSGMIISTRSTMINIGRLECGAANFELVRESDGK